VSTTVKKSPADEKLEMAKAYRAAAQFLGKRPVEGFVIGPKNPNATMTRALRDEADKLEAESKRDAFAAKATPLSALPAKPADPTAVYGPDDAGQFWQVTRATMSELRPDRGLFGPYRHSAPRRVLNLELAEVKPQ
jgi:hypothetical protein